VRGGRSLAKRIAAKERASPSLYIEEEDEMAKMPSGPYGRMSAAGRARADAHAQGAQLGRHIHSLHGAGFFDDFAKGFMSVIKPVASIASMIPGPIGTAARVATGLFGSGEMEGGFQTMNMEQTKKVMDYLRQQREAKAAKGGMNTGKYEGEGRRRKMKGGQHVIGGGKLTITHGDDSCSDDEMEGGGFISDLGIPIVSNLAGMFGLGKAEEIAEADAFLKANPKFAKGYKDKAPKKAVSAADGRRKRAEIVKRIMRERGLSMIEASRAVKAEGLY